MKKGISPLIAAVILIAIVIAVGGIAGPWFEGFLKGTTSDVEEQSEKSIDCLYADLGLGTDDIEYKDNLSSSVINLTIDNIGSEPLYNLTFSYIIDGNGYNDIDVIQNKPTEEDPLGPGSRRVLITEINNVSSLEGKTLERIRISSSICPNLEKTCDMIEEDCE